jgi:hypothetical protein
MIQHPTWANLGWLGLDALGLFPVIPGAGSVREAARLLDKLDDVSDSAKTMEKVRQAGKAGEELAGIVKSKTRIESLTRTAKFRVPDELGEDFLREVKNTKYQALTNQLRDYLEWCRANGLKFILETRTGDIDDVSGPLRKLIEDGEVILRKIGE